MNREFSTSDHAERDAESYLNSLSDKTVSRDVLIQRYNQTSEKYDESMNAVNYNGPKETASTLSSLYPSNREHVHILDIAAGTGLCAIEFRKHGFRYMDAFDASKQMLNAAKQKKLYGKYICDMLGGNTLDIENDNYDVVTICGMSTEIMRNLPIKALEELARVVKPGGYIINTGYHTTFADGNTQTEDLRRNMKTLESQGKWKQIEVRHFTGYINGKDGGVSVHKVC